MQQKISGGSTMIKFLAVIFSLLLTISFVNAEEGSTVLRGQGGSHSGGEGGKHSTGQVSIVRDVAEITYPGMSSEKGEDELRSKTILLVKPKRFDREGVYVWRDAEGVWNIQLISKGELTLNGNISTSGRIETVPQDDGRLIVEDFSKALINQESLSNENWPPIQFRVYGSYIDFTLFINGKQDPTQIYLGAEGRKPGYIPFRLEIDSEVPATRPAGYPLDRPRISSEASEGSSKPDLEPSQSVTSPGAGGQAGRAEQKKSTK
jgi:hypothetical protein